MTHPMQPRRVFLKAIGCGILTMPALIQAKTGSVRPRPNLLVIMTDQQFGDGMSCVLGREYLHTPYMDSLAENGRRFTRAYSPNPLCVPMRASMITGYYPHQTGQQTNSGTPLNTDKIRMMGRIFKDAGYETAYFGKWHINIDEQRKDLHGFDTFVEKPARLDPSHAARFLKQEHKRPYLVVASFLTPHEVCEWARKEKLPGEQLGEVPPLSERPTLRINVDPPENETDIMAFMRQAYQNFEQKGKRMFPVGTYTEDDWRRHIWGYYRLIERADGFVGTVLQALRESGQEENTVVIFLSDHGECHSAHRWNQKTVFYDESARVPFMISQKGRTPKGTSEVFVNVGVDLIPTLCDFAGVDIPQGLPGKSMKAPALGQLPNWRRDYVVSQNHMVQCASINGKHLTPHGRMVRSNCYKYCLYSEGEQRESLGDMEKDPGEMVNLAGKSDFAGVLKQHRVFLKEFAEQHGDDTALAMLQ